MCQRSTIAKELPVRRYLLAVAEGVIALARAAILGVDILSFDLLALSETGGQFFGDCASPWWCVFALICRGCSQRIRRPCHLLMRQ